MNLKLDLAIKIMECVFDNSREIFNVFGPF